MVRYLELYSDGAQSAVISNFRLEKQSSNGLKSSGNGRLKKYAADVSYKSEDGKTFYKAKIWVEARTEAVALKAMQGLVKQMAHSGEELVNRQLQVNIQLDGNRCIIDSNGGKTEQVLSNSDLSALSKLSNDSIFSLDSDLPTIRRLKSRLKYLLQRVIDSSEKLSHAQPAPSKLTSMLNENRRIQTEIRNLLKMINALAPKEKTFMDRMQAATTDQEKQEIDKEWIKWEESAPLGGFWSGKGLVKLEGKVDEIFKRYHKHKKQISKAVK